MAELLPVMVVVGFVAVLIKDDGPVLYRRRQSCFGVWFGLFWAIKVPSNQFHG